MFYLFLKLLRPHISEKLEIVFNAPYPERRTSKRRRLHNYIWPESARIAVRGHELLGPKSRHCVRLDIDIDNLAILYDPIPGEI